MNRIEFKFELNLYSANLKARWSSQPADSLRRGTVQVPAREWGPGRPGRALEEVGLDLGDEVPVGAELVPLQDVAHDQRRVRRMRPPPRGREGGGEGLDSTFEEGGSGGVGKRGGSGLSYRIVPGLLYPASGGTKGVRLGGKNTGCHHPNPIP